jgi:hypothetical protein
MPYVPAASFTSMRGRLPGSQRVILVAGQAAADTKKCQTGRNQPQKLPARGLDDPLKS